MPGSSLWLVPPQGSELYGAIHRLILHDIPSIYGTTGDDGHPTPPRFVPHVTLTSEIHGVEDVAGQIWLDALELPSNVNKHVRIVLRECNVGSAFYRKLTMLCDKTPELVSLAAQCRRRARPGRGESIEQSVEWIEANYTPHCSLMYSDLAEDCVASKFEEVRERIRQAKQGNIGVAKGAEIWLVPTDRPVTAWSPIARRTLSKVDWEWAT